MTELAAIFDATLLNSVFRFATPILLAALGGLICDRVGIFNIALEGLMLAGAFAAVVGSFYSGSALTGILVAALSGAALAAIFAFLVISLRGDMIVIGIATNLFASGMTVFLLRSLFDIKGVFNDPRIAGLGVIHLPGISAIPVIGPLLSGHSWLVYFTWLLVGGIHLLLFYHMWGLRIRGIGERPEAAAALGVNVTTMRYLAVVLSGILCGLAGAQLSLGNVTLFVEEMSAGRGWIAVVAVMLGQSHPLGVLAASTLFGLADSAGLRLQGLGMPSQFTGMVPYLVTLGALFIVRARQRQAAPTA